MNEITSHSGYVVWSWIRLWIVFFSCAGCAWSEPTLKLGWSGPLTGPSAVLGVDSLKAVQLAVEQANEAGGVGGRRIELLVEDDQYETSQAVLAYRRLAAKGAVAILASTYGGIFATAQLALRDGVIVIDPLDCNDDIAALEENTFCLATRSESISALLAADIVRTKRFPVTLVRDGKNPFMVLVERELKRLLGSAELYIIEGTQLESLRAALSNHRARAARAVVFLGHDPMGQAMREARSLGITAQFYTLGTITSPGFQQLAGPAAQDALVAYWEAPASEALAAFLDRFQARFGKEPVLQLASLPSFDAASALIETMQKVFSKRGAVEIADLRFELRRYFKHEGVSGELKMDLDGAVRSIQERLYRFNHGRLERVNLAPNGATNGAPLLKATTE